MNRTRGELFSRAALAANQYGRVSRRNLRDEFIDALHRTALADHVVFDIDVGKQTFVFVFEPFEVTRVFDRDGGDAGDRGDELQVVLVEPVSGVRRIEIEHAEFAVEHYQRNAHHGVRTRFDEA